MLSLRSNASYDASFVQVHYSERLKFHRETSDCHSRAKVYAECFNAQLRRLAPAKRCSAASLNLITMVPCSVYRLSDERVAGGFRYLAIEPQYVVLLLAPWCPLVCVSTIARNFRHQRYHSNRVIITVVYCYYYYEPYLAFSVRT